MTYETVRLVLVINGKSWDVNLDWYARLYVIHHWILSKGEERYDVIETEEGSSCNCSKSGKCIHLRACYVSGLINFMGQDHGN